MDEQQKTAADILELGLRLCDEAGLLIGIHCSSSRDAYVETVDTSLGKMVSVTTGNRAVAVLRLDGEAHDLDMERLAEMMYNKR